MNSTDVLIVGAGPVGLTLAAECHRHGIGFRIVDQNPTHSQHSKALAIWSGTIEFLAGLGLAETFLSRGRSVRRAIFEDQGQPIAEIPITEGLETLYPAPFILPQSETEEILVEHLRAQGVEVERNVQCLGVRPGHESVECDLQTSGGAVETVAARWLAGCDGARSIVRHHLPVEFPGVTEKMGFILADAKATGDLQTDSLLISSGPGGNVILFPVRDDIWRIFALRETHDDQSDPTLEEIQQHLDNAGLTRVRLSAPQWLSHFQVNERVASRNRVGRVFLLGDASHIHSPAGGQGMNTGMQDAFNLGWKLKLLTAPDGRADREALAESYFLERHPVAEMVVKETSRLLHFGIQNHPTVRTIRKVVLPWLADIGTVKKTMAFQLSELGISYAPGPLVEADSTLFHAPKDLAPGRRARNVQVFAGAQPVSLWREFLHPAFHLVLFSGRNPSEAAAHEFQRMGKAYGSDALRLLVVWKGASVPAGLEGMAVFSDDDSAHDRYGLSDAAGWYLVRPDQYIAARGIMGEEPVLHRLLFRLGLVVAA